jgi:hypothetical protein
MATSHQYRFAHIDRPFARRFYRRNDSMPKAHAMYLAYPRAINLSYRYATAFDWRNIWLCR